MATIKNLLGILCLAVIGSSGMPRRDFLNRIEPVDSGSKVLYFAQKQLGVHEKSGKNDGVQVEQYLAYVKLKKGAPWCAAFVSWVYGRAGYARPRTGWSPALFPSSRLTDQIKPACVFGIYFSDLKRIAHCGLVVKRTGGWVLTIEGNTNISGSREGDGVYRKRRHIKTIKAFADWIN